MPPRTASAKDISKELSKILDTTNITIKEIHEFSKIEYPIFSFKYLSDQSIAQCENASFFFDFLMRLQKLSQLGWKKIMLSHRHAYGTELIPVNQIKTKNAIPRHLAGEEKLCVFRAAGNNLPFIGKRVGRIFYILFIETVFGDIYDHD